MADLVANQPSGQRYLCYRTYELVRSDTEELPLDPDDLRLQELRARYPDGVIPGGGWYAHPPERDDRVD
ncbi:MAG: hypothetical protein CMH83_22615 [Nocardioides sp.]|nr:hypothetical protein [Nocardioides sp.]